MTTVVIAIGMVVVGYLVWICFLSWCVARVAFKQELPDRRAALTAGTAFALAIASSLFTIFVLPDRVPFVPRETSWSLLAMLLYVPAALVDYFMLRRAFRKGWVDDAEPFR